MLSADEYLTHIRVESELFIQTAVAGSLREPVAACPGWSVSDLVGHLGTVQQFHASHLPRGSTERPSGERPKPPEHGLAEWFTVGVNRLIATLRSVGEETPAWNFLGADPMVTGFWYRRMAHEAAVHRWDVQQARGSATPFDASLAADGVDEVLRTFVPARRRADAPDGTVMLELTDVGKVVTATYGDPDAARVVATGLAGEVLLAVWGRRPWTELDVEGPLELLHGSTAG